MGSPEKRKKPAASERVVRSPCAPRSMIASRRSPHERLEGTLCNVHLRAELCNCLERALNVVDSRADGGRDLTILGIDERGDLLQEDKERRPETVQCLAFDD